MNFEFCNFSELSIKSESSGAYFCKNKNQAYINLKNFENGKCLFGRKMKYIRRKREATCFNQEEMDKKFYVDSCPCVNDDWECDFGFYRRMEGGPCIPIADEY